MVQVKICGLTDPAQAAVVEELGADAIGMVFYPPSPRNVSLEQAQSIRAALLGRAKLVGVFVNHNPLEVARIARACPLDAVQLHGCESADEVRLLRDEGLFVIKALKGIDYQAAADAYAQAGANAFLLELGKGPLPGGNGQGWDWAQTRGFGARHPYLLAGGLTPHNIGQVLTLTDPQGVDASSALESAPGVKDMGLVELFINAVRSVEPAEQRERIFA